MQLLLLDAKLLLVSTCSNVGSFVLRTTSSHVTATAAAANSAALDAVPGTPQSQLRFHSSLWRE